MAQDQDVSRRDFVKTAAVVTAAAAAIEGAPAIQKVRAANDQVQFGMIGTGSRGSYLLKHLKGIDNGRCVALCDINADSLQNAANIIGTNAFVFDCAALLRPDFRPDSAPRARHHLAHSGCGRYPR